MRHVARIDESRLRSIRAMCSTSHTGVHCRHVMSQVFMSHLRHVTCHVYIVDTSRHRYSWVIFMSQICQVCHRYSWVIFMSHICHVMLQVFMSHIWNTSQVFMSHVSDMKTPCAGIVVFFFHFGTHRNAGLWMSRVTRMNESCHAYISHTWKWVIPRIELRRVSLMNMSYLPASLVPHMHQ